MVIKIISAAVKLKNARAVKDAKIIASSPHLKETPNMSLKQVKIMKQGTKSLAKTTSKIAKQSSKKGSYGSTTIGESNAFIKKMGLDKPTLTEKSTRFPSLSTPPLGGLKKGPENMTLNQMDRLSAIENTQKAKAYAAAYRQAKRDVKNITKAMESTKTRVAKKVVKGTAAAGAVGGSYAALESRRSR